LKSPNVFREPVVADYFEKPAASVFVAAKRRFRWLTMFGHCNDPRASPVIGQLATFPADDKAMSTAQLHDEDRRSLAMTDASTRSGRRSQLASVSVVLRVCQLVVAMSEVVNI